LRLWINDPARGVDTIRSAVPFGMRDKLKEQEVQTPFPKRNQHIRGGNMLVTLDPRRGSAAV
jgi:small-conductance mechanosensitive channel